MAKGDDAIRRKKNKSNRKRVRSSESAVSARVAAIIASKRRRKAGKRRICEGMCYTLPTPDDPFNDRHGKKDPEKKKIKKKSSRDESTQNQDQDRRKMLLDLDESVDNLVKEQSCPSKFLIVCLNAIKNAWREEGEEGEFEESDISLWGLDLWRSCSNGSCNVLDTSGPCATREQIAWLVSGVSDIMARKEKQGILVSSPYLLYIVPTQEKAVKVRTICKPLKELGIHAVSLHSGASIEHQLLGLKSCEPEFLVSTPGRLLELVALNAIDISSVSLLVIDGLGTECAEETRYAENLISIKEAITSSPHIIVFSDHCDQKAALVHNLLGGPIARLSLSDSVTSRSAFISQHVYHCPSHELKVAKIQDLLLQSMGDEYKFTKVLLVINSESKNEVTASRLSPENCTVSGASSGSSFSLHRREKVMRVVMKDKQSLQLDKIENFEMVLIADFPSSIEEYVEILTSVARHSVNGAVHCLFSQADAHLAKSLVDILTGCKQIVPQFLLDFDS